VIDLWVNSNKLHIIFGKAYSLLVISVIQYTPPLTKETYYKKTKTVVGIAIVVGIPRSFVVQCNSIDAWNLMSTHASVLVDSVGPPSAEVCRTAASFP
jgi:hypothetical protein